MALWKDIMDSQKQKIFIFQVAEPFIRFFGVYSFTQWHRASPFYLPLLEICFTVSASLVPLATKGGRSGGRTAGIRRAIAPTAPRWIGEGFFQRGSVVAVVKSSQRASLDVKSQVTQPRTDSRMAFLFAGNVRFRNNKLIYKCSQKMKPEEFHKRIEGLHVQLPNECSKSFHEAGCIPVDEDTTSGRRCGILTSPQNILTCFY